jgi:hypothetical protein
MTIEQMEQELKQYFGDQFFQIAFYVDDVNARSIGRCWVKIEHQPKKGRYRVWQQNNCPTLIEAYKGCLQQIKEDLGN